MFPGDRGGVVWGPTETVVGNVGGKCLGGQSGTTLEERTAVKFELFIGKNRFTEEEWNIRNIKLDCLKTEHQV